MPQGIEKVTIQIIDTPTKVYAIGAKLFLSKVPLEVLQNWVLIQLIVTPHVLGKVQGQIKEMCRLIEPCLLIGTREYWMLQRLEPTVTTHQSPPTTTMSKTKIYMTSTMTTRSNH